MQNKRLLVAAQAGVEPREAVVKITKIMWIKNHVTVDDLKKKQQSEDM